MKKNYTPRCDRSCGCGSGSRKTKACWPDFAEVKSCFRGLFEQAAVGMCVVGSDGRLLRVNDKLCSITGRAEHDLMKQELRDLTHPDDRAEHESQVGTLLLGGISEVSLEQRLMRPDGDTIWVTVTLSIQWDAGGRIQSLIGVIEDIDARKRAELELRTHTARQQLLSKTMDQLLRVDDPADVMQDIYASLRTSVGVDTFLDYDATPDNVGIRMSAWAGIPEEALEPLMFLEFGQALCGTSAVSRKPVIVERLQSSTDPKASRMQAVGSTAYACFPLIVGDRLLGTLAFASSHRQAFDPDDVELLEAVSNYVAMAKERRRLLHETRQRAEQVAEQEERLRFATDGAGMGTWDVDLRTGRVVWNRQNALLLGYDSEASQASTKRWWALVHEDDRPAVRQAMKNARNNGSLYQSEHRIRRADTGELRWLAPYGRIHYNGDGRPTRFVGVTFDVTERKQTDMQRQEWTRELERRVNERTKELVRTHDRLRGLAQDLTLTEQRERQRIAGELHDYLAQMLVVTRLKMNHASQMIAPHPACTVLQEADQLIDQSLTYTRTVVAELMPPTLRQFGLAAGLRWLGDRMEQQGLIVHVDVPSVAPPLSEDHTTMLFQCVRELLFNVLKHAGTDRASIEMAEDGEDKLKIVVHDDGVGCDPIAIRGIRGGQVRPLQHPRADGSDRRLDGPGVAAWRRHNGDPRRYGRRCHDGGGSRRGADQPMLAAPPGKAAPLASKPGRSRAAGACAACGRSCDGAAGAPKHPGWIPESGHHRRGRGRRRGNYARASAQAGFDRDGRQHAKARRHRGDQTDPGGNAEHLRDRPVGE